MSKKNVWISILRIICCYLVVLNHFGRTDFCKMLATSVTIYAIPIFMFLSFYLCGNKLFENEGYIKKRLKRLYYPIFLWSIVYYLLYNSARAFVNKELIPIKDLMYSLVTGVSERLNTPMWFSMELILLSILMYMILVCERSERKRKIIYAFLIILAELLIYSGVNFYLFGGLRFESGLVISRLFECIPFAAMGMIVSGSNKKNVGFIAISSLLLTVIFWNVSKPNGFVYQGVQLLTVAVLICTVAILLPNPSKSKMTVFFDNISKYTMGIYYIHIGTGYFLTLFPIVNSENMGIIFALVVMLVSLSIVFVMNKIAEKVPAFQWMKYMVV